MCKSSWQLFCVVASVLLFVASTYVQALSFALFTFSIRLNMHLESLLNELLTKIFYRTAQSDPQECTSTRTNSTCEYFVCGSNCSDFGVPEDALTYDTVDMAIQAVADESRGSYFNRIYLMPSLHYTANATNISAIALEIRGFYPSYPALDLPTLAASGNLALLSESLVLADLELAPHDPSTSTACIDTTDFQDIDLAAFNTHFSCVVKIHGQGNFNFQDKTFFLSSLHITLSNGTLNMSRVNLSDTTFNVFGPSSVVTLQRLSISKPLSIILDRGSLSITNSTISKPLQISTIATDLETSGHIFIKNSCFLEGFTLLGLYWNASISHNCFYSGKSEYQFLQQGTADFESYAFYSPNALISATCNASLRLTSNYFWNGTLFFDFPYEDLIKLRCHKAVSNPYSWFKVQKNRFQPFIFQKSVYGKYIGDFEDVLPAISVLSPWSSFSPNTRAATPAHLDFPRNWWGHASGPYLCCNPNGKGGFTTPFANISDWCLTEDCLTTSNSTLPTSCFLHGCPQSLYSGFIPLTSTISSFGLMVSLVAIVVATVVYKRQLASDLVQYIDSEELIDRSFRVYTIGSAASTFANITVVVAMALCVQASVSTRFAPLQQAVTFGTLALFMVYIVLASVQVIYNIVLWFFLFFRARITMSKVAPLLRIFWVWNCLALCVIVTSTFSWSPVLHHSSRASSDDEPMVKGHALWLLSSDHNLFLLIGIVVSFFALLASMVPARFIHIIVCYPEYSKMSTTLEVSLMRHVVKIPRVVRLSKISTYLCYFALPVGVATLAMEIALLAHPSLFYDVSSMASGTFMPAGYLRIRLGLGSFFMLVGLITVAVALWASKVVRKVGVYSMLLLFLIISVSSTGSTLSTFSSTSKINLKYAIPLLILNVLWLLSVIAIFLLIRSIRASALNELPKYARDGINDHADEYWHSPTSPRREISETSPLLVTVDRPSSDESPILPPDMIGSM